MRRSIRTMDDVLDMLDRLFAADADRWTGGAAGLRDDFYADRAKPVPFFVPKPDENRPLSCVMRTSPAACL
jgi:hypothetical protein